MSKKKKRRRLVICLILFLLVISILLYYLIFYKNPTSRKTIDEINVYGYKLEDRDTKLMKDTFNSLKSVLNKEEINYEKYAEIISKLFIIDLYTIDNKLDSYDIGGMEFVHPDDVSEYKANVKNTLYNYIGSIDNREEKMPEVKSIKLRDIKESTFTYNEKEYDSYIVSLSWDYVKNLGYDDEGYVTVIKDDDKLYVTEFSTKEVEHE